MTKPQPTVSIIIPCYNVERYVAQTIESVLNQNYTNWECILINDGSIDNSEHVIKSYLAKNDRLRYFYQDNAGVCAARNYAISKSIGSYVLCLDGDDLISPNFLSETVQLFESDPTITVATSTVRFFGRSKGTLKVVSYDIDVLLAENQLIITSLFRREDFERVGGFNLAMKNGFEDWDFWISLLKNQGKVACAPGAIFYYRLLSVSRNIAISRENEALLRFQMWQNHRELYTQYFVDPLNFFEYKRVANSPEYRLGSFLLSPIRRLKSAFFALREFLSSKVMK